MLLWRPIRTAPKNGASLLLWDKVNAVPVVGAWNPTGFITGTEPEPGYWMTTVGIPRSIEPGCWAHYNAPPEGFQ